MWWSSDARVWALAACVSGCVGAVQKRQGTSLNSFPWSAMADGLGVARIDEHADNETRERDGEDRSFTVGCCWSRTSLAVLVMSSSELAGARATAGEGRRAEELGLLQDLGGNGGWTGGKK